MSPFVVRGPRAGDRQITSGIIFVIGKGSRWREPPDEYGPVKPIHQRFHQLERPWRVNKIFAMLGAKGAVPD